VTIAGALLAFALAFQPPHAPALQPSHALALAFQPPAQVPAIASLPKAHAAAPTPAPVPTLSPTQWLATIRNKFRSHRPPPPYVVYTESRKQNTDRGFLDYADSYSYKYWCRTSDRAALKRKIEIVPAMGFAEFERAAFNADYDPGPPTGDLFEKAPAHPVAQSVVPTPEPEASPLQTIGQVAVTSEYEYKVTSVTFEGKLVHLVLEPIRDPERNRLREIWADKDTYELVRIKAHDRLFVPNGVHGDDIYGVIFDIKIAMLQGTPIVTDIHGIVGDNYSGDGQIVDFTFRNIAFPTTLPDWYFDPKTYGSHPEKELPR
jgi:hypothetical protein